MQTELHALLDEIWRAVEARADKVTGKRVGVPPVVPMEELQPESRFGADFPVLGRLAEALELARDFELAELADGFAALVETLAWSQNPSYDETNCDPSFLAGYAYAALSGPEGPVHCAAPRGGLMLMGPHVTYPDHRHGPREVYLLLTPGAEWRLDGGEWFEVSAGDLIFHDAWQMHAMRTTGQPMLAFAGWVEPGRRLDIEMSG